VLTHPKQGFSLRALQDFNYDAALDRVREGHWVREGMWSPAWSELTAPGVPYRNARIWVLLVLTLWAEAHLS
jgi:hypothetical protein